MKTKILISAANGVVMTSLIKELKKKFYIVGIDANKDGNAKKYCDQFHVKPKSDDKTFIKFINRVGNQVDYIFLFNDREIFRINSNRKLIKSIDKIILSNKKTIDICLNKKKFYTFCKLNNINIPTTQFSKNMIARPIFGTGSKDIFRINNKQDYNYFSKKKIL